MILYAMNFSSKGTLDKVTWRVTLARYVPGHLIRYDGPIFIGDDKEICYFPDLGKQKIKETNKNLYTMDII